MITVQILCLYFDMTEKKVQEEGAALLGSS